MRYVGMLPHTDHGDHYATSAAEGLVGKTVPFRSEIGTVPEATATILAARVADDGLHLEFEVNIDDADASEALHNLVLYGTPHRPETVVPVQAGFSIGYRVGTAEVDPLLRIGCIQPHSSLDSHESRDALRDIVKAATEQFFSEEARRVPPSTEV